MTRREWLAVLGVIGLGIVAQIPEQQMSAGHALPSQADHSVRGNRVPGAPPVDSINHPHFAVLSLAVSGMT